MRSWLYVGLVTLLLLTAVGSSVRAAGKLDGTYLNTIDNELSLYAGGRLVYVSGPIGCPKGDLIQIRVKVTQPATGAVGEGRFLGICSGDQESWSAIAGAHAWATVWDANGLVKSWDWQKEITLRSP